MSTLAEQIAAVKLEIVAMESVGYDDFADSPEAKRLAAMRSVLATLEGLAAPGETPHVITRVDGALSPSAGIVGPHGRPLQYRDGVLDEAPTDAPDPVEAYVSGPLPDCMMPDGGQACVAYQQLHAAFAKAETDAFLRGQRSGKRFAELEAKYGAFQAADAPDPQRPPDETPPDDAALKDAVGRAICKSRTCEGVSCCQWPANLGRTQCPVDSGGYDDAASAAIKVIRERLPKPPVTP